MIARFKPAEALKQDVLEPIDPDSVEALIEAARLAVFAWHLPEEHQMRETLLADAMRRLEGLVGRPC